jgi:hypothetical protein
VVGCGGVRQQIELTLSDRERLGIQNSARVLQETIDQVEARLGKAPSPRADTRPMGNGRSIPRSAWQPVRS